ncbi:MULTISPECIES: hypothetical protein [Bacillota]|uniref:Uncharacterized protein n=1 Tax=Virgibacillus pantothenticus TaxID=1473 RepID=A0A0L0QQF2_VIRPA|nr:MULTISPECIES: hypothetical protein [Bacillota]API90834.1 hypothetical protein BKP57_02580 [Virgibacillus sp. 6R]KNE20781.1 hypothetical protein AFK71_20905 [Virgibacillus pantothenticus]MBS7426731.1 hypothetical protein [Virgibacillus sp. 19R1-5]MED3738640.1 hypothetical protein [Virgibacillus pantothenticus]NBJ69002.1 hypothetical protein [Roseburia sp. 1XD42-34]
MWVISRRKQKDEKIARLKQGDSAYAESQELIRLMKRDIEKEHLQVIYEETTSGCWFIPVDNNKRTS